MHDSNALIPLGLIPLIPFIGFVINGLFGKRAGNRFVSVLAVGASLLTAIVSTVAAVQYQAAYHHGERHLEVVYNWISSGSIGADIAFQLDPLSIVMLMVVTWVGFLIHLYSTGYMAHEDGYYRYFAYLNLFLSAMLILILGSSYLFVFVGWEGVGLCSYLLIGFYYDKEYAAAAGKKAFVVNRIGDFGFLIAMFLMFVHAGSVDFAAVSAKVAEGALSSGVITAICLLLFLGACGKSAQIPLYVWLPDAMAGPTPVSALIHAATMVTAGIYVVVRSNVLFRSSTEALMVVAVIGAATALFAATIGVAQNDIKKVLAYSTVSQLGFMFIAAGVGAFVAAIFHLVTHAFFKACLFLGSGSVIHAMGGEQDIRKMGGLRKKLPVTFWTFAIATLAIAGFPPLAGFFSKDEILASAWATPYFNGKIIYIIGSIAALLTSFYMFRLLYLTFFGTFRGTHDQEHHLHESPKSMTIPLMVLAFLSAVGGLIGLPHYNKLANWLHPIFPQVSGLPEGHFAIPGRVELIVAIVSTGLAILGWWLARSRYLKPDPSQVAEGEPAPGFMRTLSNKYYVDEIYEGAIVKPLRVISMFLWKAVDAAIDGLLALGGYIVAGTGDLLRYFQTGNVRNYALMFFLGVIVFVWIYV